MWHEARRSERKVHDIMDAARKRAERRAVFLAKRRGDPHQQLKVAGTRCRMYHDQAMYQATQDQHGLIPWNGKKDNLIDRFDGRALLDFIREADKTRPRREKTEEEEELEELVNFERYRDLIKRRRRGFSDEQGLLDVDQELESRAIAPLLSDRQRAAAGKGTYAQVGFAYDGDGKEGSHVVNSDEDDDDDDLESSSEDSEDEEIECIGKDHGVQRFNWMAYMDRKAKEAEKRQKEAAKGDPSMRKLSRKERRKASQQEREREREAARISGHRYTYSDPYREPRGSPTYHTYYRSRRGRSRSRSRSLSPPGRSRRHGYSERTRESDTAAKRKPVTGKIEYITEFGCDNEGEARTAGGISPPPSPPSQADPLNRHPTGRILEALHGDPAASVGASFPTDWEKNNQKKEPRISTCSTSSAIAKLSKPAGSQKAQQGEKKETPQERLKRIMSKQLNKQIKKDTVSEMLKRREQDRQRQEKLAETRRIAHYRRRSHSSSRSYSRSRSRSHSPARHARSRSRSPTRSPSRSSYPRSPRNRSRTMK